MATLLVGYDLNAPRKDYKSLIGRLKKVGTTRWHCLDSTWLIKTEQTPELLAKDLRRFMDRDDELLVIDVTRRGWYAYLKSHDWLQANV
jgi:hypothetical protein